MSTKLSENGDSLRGERGQATEYQGCLTTFTFYGMLSRTTLLHSVHIAVEVYTLGGLLVFEKVGGQNSCLIGLALILAPFRFTQAHQLIILAQIRRFFCHSRLSLRCT